MSVQKGGKKQHKTARKHHKKSGKSHHKKSGHKKSQKKSHKKSGKRKTAFQRFLAYNSLLASDRCKNKMEHFNSSTV